ncbi:MAG: hypothetical protein JXA25_04980 [Anaerolineales bacterium]|nr:hypothetical protein [Anaerolineales bacterium]
MAKNRNSKDGRSILLNLLTVAILVATLGVVAVYATIFLNPTLPFNPFPPPTANAALQEPTTTKTPAVYLPPTWTPTPDLSTATPTETNTPRPSQTPTRTTEPTITPTVDENITQAPFSPTFVLQTNSPSYTENFANDQECEWMGIAGQVFDLSGAPLSGVTIHINGALSSQAVDLYAESGSAEVYGPSGYEFVLSDVPVTSTNTLWLQVFDLEEEQPLSEKIFLSTYNDCTRNLVLVNWNLIKE